MGAEPFLIVSTVKTIIGQRLVRRLVSSKEKYFLSDAEIKNLERLIDLDRMLDFLKVERVIDQNATWKQVPFYRPIKSEESEDGYLGRLGIHEVLKVSPTVRETIMQGKTSRDIEEVACKEGMTTMIEDGIFKAVQGLTTIEEVLRVISE